MLPTDFPNPAVDRFAFSALSSGQSRVGELSIFRHLLCSHPCRRSGGLFGSIQKIRYLYLIVVGNVFRILQNSALEIVLEKFLRRFLALAFINGVFGIFSSLNHMATVVSTAFCQSNIMQTAAAIVVDYPPRKLPR